MGPDVALPLPAEFDDIEAFIESLLKFTTSSWLLQTLCGGVHILDFYTRSPNIYSTILPESWRAWFKDRDIMDVLDLLMREDLVQIETGIPGHHVWRDGPAPPDDLLRYIKHIRKHLLARNFSQPDSHPKPKIPRHIALGMKVKKVHEVYNFAQYIENLTSEINGSSKSPITHLVDFGSGQNYLGRTLGAPPYSKHIVAVESKQKNIEGAKNMDILAKLVPKPLVMRNKKEYRARTGTDKKDRQRKANGSFDDISTAPPAAQPSEDNSQVKLSLIDDPQSTIEQKKTTTTNLQVYNEGQGSVQYVEHIIKDGDLTPVIDQVLDASNFGSENSSSTSAVTKDLSNLEAVPKVKDINAMVISLHSCGNLVHYGLRSLLLNSHISAVAMVGCCYNLVTERLGPPTYKLPTLRPNHPRLVASSNAFDPNGFPMSERLANYPLPQRFQDLSTKYTFEDKKSKHGPEETEQARGLRLNITARMMAVQAPFNWGRGDSELFFTRHFYRALLQRIFLERGVVSAPIDDFPDDVSAHGHTSQVNWTPPNGRGPGLSSNGTTTPLTIGTLRKFAYGDFVSYVRAAIDKLISPNSFCEVDPNFIREKMEGLTDEEIRRYETEYAERKKELSVMWSLMAFSAGVVESVIVVDRWLWLMEQDEVEKAWVEPVFEYKYSPRNLVVVGIKKGAGKNTNDSEKAG